MGWTALIYGLGSFASLVDWTVTKATGKPIIFTLHIPHWSVAVWIAIGLGLLFLLAIEGSLEFTHKTASEHAQDLATKDTEYSATLEQLREAHRTELADAEASRIKIEQAANKALRDKNAEAFKIQQMLADRASTALLSLERTKQELAEEQAKVAEVNRLIAVSGPQVWLSWEEKAGHTGVFVQNRSNVDAVDVTIKPIKSEDRTLAGDPIPLLAFGIPPLPFYFVTTVNDKSTKANLRNFVYSPNNTDAVTVEFTLVYADHWGSTFERDITVKGTAGSFWGLKDDLLLTNGPVRVTRQGRPFDRTTQRSLGSTTHAG